MSLKSKQLELDFSIHYFIVNFFVNGGSLCNTQQINHQNNIFPSKYCEGKFLQSHAKMRVAFANVYCAQQWNANLLKYLHVYQHTLFHCKFIINSFSNRSLQCFVNESSKNHIS